MGLMPDFYRPPQGLPLRWQDEQSGKLVRAVAAYFLDDCTQEQVDLVIEYCRYYIQAPCWDMGCEGVPECQEELKQVRSFANSMSFKQDINIFIEKCFGMGIDPL